MSTNYSMAIIFMDWSEKAERYSLRQEIISITGLNAQINFMLNEFFEFLIVISFELPLMDTFIENGLIMVVTKKKISKIFVQTGVKLPSE